MKPADLEVLQTLVRERCGLDLKEEKAFFAESRLSALARREGETSATAIVERLRQGADDRLASAAAEALAVTDTAFFRDGAAFEAIAAVVGALAAGHPDRPVQAWSAGCSTGQEAYSLAMLGQERHPPVRLEIVATDLSERVLEKAHSGLYTQFEVQRGLPIRLLLKHFEKVGETWAISPRLRSEIRWRRLNLLDARRSVRRYDLVLCRYVLGYMAPEARGPVLSNLAAALSPDGYLALSPEDAPPAGFEAAGPGLFRRTPEAARAASAA